MCVRQFPLCLFRLPAGCPYSPALDCRNGVCLPGKPFFAIRSDMADAAMYLLDVGLVHSQQSGHRTVPSALQCRGCRTFGAACPFGLLPFYHLLDLCGRAVRLADPSRDDYPAKGPPSGANRWRFILNHAGLWLALFAGVVGSTEEQTLRIPVFRDRPNSEAFTEEGAKIYLSKELQLNDFVVEHYSNGVPRHFFAEISIDGKLAHLEVNHPYAANWAEDYYLTSYDVQSEQPQYCVLQIVREPLKYVMWVGIVMMLCGACLLFLSGPNEPNNALCETSR